MRKKYSVRITAAAQQDVADLWEYIAADDPDAATEFIRQVEKRILSLAGYPLRYPLIPENAFLDTLYRHAVYGDYRIIYRIAGPVVYVLRVIHRSRLLDLD